MLIDLNRSFNWALMMMMMMHHPNDFLMLIRNYLFQHLLKINMTLLIIVCAFFFTFQASRLADHLMTTIPSFHVNTIVKSKNDWQRWLQDFTQKNDWHHSTSPLVFIEQPKRELIGGFDDFSKWVSS